MNRWAKSTTITAKSLMLLANYSEVIMNKYFMFAALFAFILVSFAEAFPQGLRFFAVDEKGALEELRLADGKDLSNRVFSYFDGADGSKSFILKLSEEFTGNAYKKVNFDYSDLSYAFLASVDFKESSFRKSQFSYATLRNVFRKCDFTGANLSKIKGVGIFIDCVMKDADISDAQLCSISAKSLMQTKNYQKKNLSYLTLSEFGSDEDVQKDCPEIDFSNFNLQGAKFGDEVYSRAAFCKIHRCKFTNAHIWFADFRTTDITVEQVKSTKTYKDGDITVYSVKLPPKVQKELDAEEASAAGRQ
jgi:uncharacterized protein YjbI with pentapeptide repeats